MKPKHGSSSSLNTSANGTRDQKNMPRQRRRISSTYFDNMERHRSPHGDALRTRGLRTRGLRTTLVTRQVWFKYKKVFKNLLKA